ncbi:hypothetical protein GLR48_07020 [Loktanella sp. M215]|nr:hypothetical protein [Loktanella sp. M215]
MQRCGRQPQRVGCFSAPSICSSNAKQSWAARTRLHTGAAFHGIFQAGYTSALAPMCIGSHYAVRRNALRAVGGLACARGAGSAAEQPGDNPGRDARR